MYVMISAQEFCDVTGLSLSTFKNYRKKFKNLPDEGRFPEEVYEYHNTAIFDVEELCDWWIEMHVAKAERLEQQLSDAMHVLQDYFKTKDLTAVDDMERRAGSSLVPHGMQGRLREAYRVYGYMPDMILGSRKLLAATEALMQERAS